MLHSLRSFTTTRGFSFQSSIINLQQLLNDNYVIYLTVCYVNFTNLCDNCSITKHTSEKEILNGAEATASKQIAIVKVNFAVGIKRHNVQSLSVKFLSDSDAAL